MSQLCFIYGWLPEYVLDQLTLDQAYFYLGMGLEHEEARATLLVAKLGQAMDGQMTPLIKAERASDKPDKRKFYERYPGRIKGPGKESGEK